MPEAGTIRPAPYQLTKARSVYKWRSRQQKTNKYMPASPGDRKNRMALMLSGAKATCANRLEPATTKWRVHRSCLPSCEMKGGNLLDYAAPARPAITMHSPKPMGMTAGAIVPETSQVRKLYVSLIPKVKLPERICLFFSRPPTYVSSTSTGPVRIGEEFPHPLDKEPGGLQTS